MTLRIYTMRIFMDDSDNETRDCLYGSPEFVLRLTIYINNMSSTEIITM